MAKFVCPFAELCLVIVVDDENLLDLLKLVLGPFMIVDSNRDVAIRVIFRVIFLIPNIGAADPVVSSLP